MFPESTFLFECACSDDPGAARGRREPRPRGPRLRRLPRHDPLRREDRRRDDAPGRRLRARRRADPRALRQRVGEGVHARTTPSASKRAQEFRKQVDKQFSFGGARSDREDAAIPIAWKDRKEAGFTEEELDELTQISGEGPRRETLHRRGEDPARAPSRQARGRAQRGGRGVSERLYPGIEPGRAHHLRSLLGLRRARRPARAPRPLRRRGDRAPRAQLPLRRGVDDDDPRRLDRDHPRGAGEDRPRQDHLGVRAGRRRRSASASPSCAAGATRRRASESANQGFAELHRRRSPTPSAPTRRSRSSPASSTC